MHLLMFMLVIFTINFFSSRSNGCIEQPMMCLISDLA